MQNLKTHSYVISSDLSKPLLAAQKHIFKHVRRKSISLNTMISKMDSVIDDVPLSGFRLVASDLSTRR